MEFRFNFGGEDETCTTSNATTFSYRNENLRKCLKHKCHLQHSNSHKLDEFNQIKEGEIALYYLKPEIATQKVKTDDMFSLLQLSDLVSGEYEGGLKLWECTVDLLQYLTTTKFPGLNVLDLGCGSGLLGVYSYILGAEKVCLQDYNAEVIEHFTIPCTECTIRNANKDVSEIDKFDFLSGDWTNVSMYLTDYAYDKFDLILSSETIYNVNYYYKLKDILQNHLSEGGIALFAAKKHYFGVGGGTLDFTEYLKNDGTFDISVVKTIGDYLPREILEVRKAKI